ncbi:T9SS-dependent choice-of-anchor J family protein [Rufibacter immobilis]|uniref:T9SS-dependent choice-of-anchor J family protein n=1 Tax=Rufibacter immobilis TaxID=1348778 RepID=UPI001616124E|nr:choice-of-anchor J domain-containing protein [Rufibacter immobilis]
MEKYRKGSNSAGFSIQLYYSKNGENWVSAGDDFNVSFGADTETAGFSPAPGATVSVKDKTLSLALAAGETRYLAWNYSVTSGSTTSNAQALGIDDIVIEADNTPPTLVSSIPASGATNVATNLDVVLTFNEDVFAGTGNFTLTPQNGNSTSVAATDSRVVFSGRTVTIRNVEMVANTVYVGTIDNNAVKDGAGNFFAGISGNTLTFTTAAKATPQITASQSSISFPAIALANKVNAVYELSAANLSGEVTVAVTGPFEISKTEGSYATTPLVFTKEELATAQKVYVRFSPAALGATTGTISHTSAGAEPVTVTLTGLAVDPYNQNFNDPAFLTTSGWTQYSVTGAQVWASTNFGHTCLTGCNASTPDKAAQISGFAGSAIPNEDWLVSPQLDLTTFTNTPVLEFWTISAFEGNQLKLMYSTDYTGTGNPNTATWTELPGGFPASNSSLWTLSQGIELPKTAKYVAFVYTSTAEGASRWTVDDFKIQDASSYHSIPTLTLNFGEVASGSKSAAQNFTFKAIGYGDLTATAPAGFELSANNGNSFASTITVSAAEAAAGKTVQVRFAPTTKQLKVEGQIAITGTGLQTSTIAVLGSSYLRAETFDVATYNMEFFGNGTQISGEFGPKDRTQQISNATTVLSRLNMDIIGIEEISDETAVDAVIANLPGTYAKSISQVYSYSIKPNTSTNPFPAQKIGFIYNTATVTPVGFRVMFKELYEKAVAGTTTAISDDFWSSGRLPYMGTFDVTLNGITKRIRVIDIHAKSGSATADYNRRVEDLAVLKDSIDTYYGAHNVILLGDFNDNVFGSIKEGAESSYNSFVADVADYKTLTYSLAQNGGFSFPSSKSFLDHIIISNELTDEYLDNSITIEDPSSYVPSYASTTSDHLPVYARFAFTTADPLGVKEDMASAFRLSPNPTTGAVSLRLPAGAAKEKLSATVYSLRGEVLLQVSGSEQKLNEALSKTLGSSAAGLYLVKVQAGSQAYQTRIIKK